MDIQSIKNRFGIIGNSPALNYALQVATQVANTDLTVLIAGESGVGKEIFSQIIHTLSPRKHNRRPTTLDVRPAWSEAQARARLAG